MSKIGKKPIEIPQEVTVDIKDGEIIVVGPLGSLSLKIPQGLKVEVKEGRIIQVSRKNQSRETKVLQGTTRQLIQNMLKGVKDGWSRTLEIVGTGYQATLDGEKLLLSLGYSHQIEVAPPPGISFAVTEKKITVSGPDKMLVGQLASRIRAIKPPDAYKGKGIRYEQEIIKLKPGKQVKVGVAGVGITGAQKGGTR